MDTGAMALAYLVTLKMDVIAAKTTDGGMTLDHADASLFLKRIDTVSALVQELSEEASAMATALEARLRAAEAGGRAKLRIISNDDGGSAA